MVVVWFPECPSLSNFKVSISSVGLAEDIFTKRTKTYIYDIFVTVTHNLFG